MSSSLDHVGEEIAEDVTRHDAALHRILTKLRVFDDGGGYVSQGFRTCAQWLSWRVNWSVSTAREHVRVANALGGLPLIDRAFECGQLSYCKVRALTRVATAHNEAELLEMAFQMTGHHLEKLCRKFAGVKNHDDPTGTSRPTTPDDDIHRRYVHRRDREDGMVVIEAVLHPDEADIVSAALERIAKERCRAPIDHADAAASVVAADAIAVTAVAASAIAADTIAADTIAADTIAADTIAADTIANAIVVKATPAAAANDVAANDVTANATPTVAAATKDASAEALAPRVRQPTRAFDRATALVEMAQQVLRGTSPDRAPTDIMISIPIETLTRSRSSDIKSCCSSTTPCLHATDDPLRVGFGGNETFVSAIAARRLACDAGLVALIEKADGGTLSVGRKTRTIPASTKRAMLRRDHKCRYPGCNARAFLEGHHLVHWADGGATEINNLISLCGYHHRFVHEYGFTLEFDAKTNTVSVYDPARGRRIPAVARTEPPVDLDWPNLLGWSEHSITATTQQTWDATPVDYGEIVDIILRAEARAECAAELDDLEPN